MFTIVWQLTVLLLIIWSNSEASFWPRVPGPNDGICVFQNTKLLSLLNLLCNATQTTSVQMRDACYGCFFRAGNILDGTSQLYSLSDCARLYIQQSNYSTCATNLQAIVDGNRPAPDVGSTLGGFCYSGYCEFVRCIKRINTQQLISSCYVQAMGSRDLTATLDQIYFFTNITSCILARTRCSQYNPITGELQNTLIRPPVVGPSNVGAIPVVGAVTPSMFNALQISETGDIRILAFPTVTTAAITDPFCAMPTPLLQSGFGTYLC